MTNTNARVIQDDSNFEYAELPDPKTLELGTEVQSKQQQQQKQKANDDADNGDEGADEVNERLTALEKQLKEKDSFIGRQSNEIGHLRDLTDQLLQSRVHQSSSDDSHSSQSTDANVQVSSDDLFENPTEAIQRAVKPLLESTLTQIRDVVGSAKVDSAADQFAKNYPTYREDMANPEFQQFVQASKYRTRLAMAARQNNDFDAASELWDAYAEHKATSQTEEDDDLNAEVDEQAKEAAKRKQAQALNDASTVRSGGKGGSDISQKPVYSAVKLQQMRNSDPDGYYSPAFQELIVEAYREGRVR
jgi:hypothetical protein